VKKVLIFSTNYLPNIGGAELAIKEITDRLPDIDFDLITPRYRVSLAKCEKIGRVWVYRVGLGTRLDKFLIPITGFFKGLRLHREHAYDSVWCMMASQASVAAAFFKMVKPRIPLVLTVQEGDEEGHLARYALGVPFLYRLLIRPWHVLIFKVADVVTVISNYLATRARQYNVSVPIELVPNGVDVKRFSSPSSGARANIRRTFGFSDTDPVIITLSRLVQKNCIGDIIQALKFLPETYKLLIVGSGGLEASLHSLACDIGVAKRVVFAGTVSPHETPEYLAAADVFVRPSASEGFGISFIEAMAASVPVVATAVGGIVDFLEDKKTGLVCEVKNPEDIARKINILVRDRALRDGIVVSAFAMVSLKYDWSGISEQMRARAFNPVFTLKKERILIATGIYPPEVGGPATYAKALTEILWKQGYANTVVTYGWEKKLPIVLRHFVYFFRLFLPIRSSDWVLALDTFSSGMPAVWASTIFREKAIVRVGGDFLWEHYIERTGDRVSLPDFYKITPPLSFKERLIRRLSLFTLHRASLLVFSTEWQRKLWRVPFGLKTDRTLVIENYYGEKIASVAPSEKNFIWAGRPITLKNVTLLKSAFTRAEEKASDITLECLAVPHQVLMEKIRRAYAIILPSISEVSPNFILEAIRYEKPFIVSKYCGILDRIGELGVTVDPLRQDSITEAVLKLSDDATYAHIRKALHEFTFTHTWDEIAEAFVNAFKRL